MSRQVVAEAPAALWAIVELMGHRRIAGRVSEEQRYGVTLLRVDEPRADGGFRSSLYGGASLYGVHFVEEHEAREAAKHASPRPFSWILDRAALPAPAPRDGFDEPGDDPPDDDDEHTESTECGKCGGPLGDEFVIVNIERDVAGDLETLREMWHRDCAEEHAAQWKDKVVGPSDLVPRGES